MDEYRLLNQCDHKGMTLLSPEQILVIHDQDGPVLISMFAKNNYRHWDVMSLETDSEKHYPITDVIISCEQLRDEILQEIKRL